MPTRKSIRGEASGRSVDLDAFSAVSHEMRSPLAAIRMTSDLLRAYFDVIPVQRRNELLDVLDSSSARLGTLLEDIALVTKIDGAHLSVQHRLVHAALAAREAISRSQRDFSERTFIAHYCDEETLLRADERRVIQVLVNLLSNAAKYSFPGTPIVLRVEKFAPSVRFTVINQGPGIDAGARRTIFTRFGKPDGMHESAVGLGLYICKELVHLMGGTIHFESVPNAQTSFWFSLPRVRSRKRAHSEAGTVG